MAVRFGPIAVSSQNLDHLGLVAGMDDELGIGEGLDRTIAPETRQRHLSIGQAVKALVGNGLGFINRALYLAPQLFADNPTERLIGPGLVAEHLNADVLGRALDRLYEHAVTTLFMLSSAQACQRLGLVGAPGPLDSTSFQVDGDYDHAEASGVVMLPKGYSRDPRPDLNQVMLNLIVEHRPGLPLLMQPLSGNSNDPTSFGRLIEAHIDQLNPSPQVDYWVADRALYRAANRQLLAAHRGHWSTRLPETVKLAQQQSALGGEPTVLLPGSCSRRLEVDYGGVRQRWLIIPSVHALQRAVPSVARQLPTTSAQELKAWHRLSRQHFACEADARQALVDFQAPLKVLYLTEAEVQCLKPGQQSGWSVIGRPTSDAQMRWSWRWTRATLILATHELNQQRLSEQDRLRPDKQQSQAERGFGFLKAPRVQAHPLFLKSPQRIRALMMIMTVCLLVYAALEYRLRQALANPHPTVPDQPGNPTPRPPLRWVFQLFIGIHVLLLEGQAAMGLNLKPPKQQVIQLLGPPYQALYT